MGRLHHSKRIGQKLRQWREACELSIDDVAGELQVSTTILAGIESGIIRTPPGLLKSFVAIYRVADRELKEFLDEGSSDS
jgi:predicted transcriptional regulator